MKRLLFGFLLFYCGWQMSCIPPQPVEYGDIQADFRDTVFQRISDLQNRQDVDQLYAYLRHPNPTYRFLAARAFGSIGEESELDSLLPLLRDPAVKVRAIAAFSIGQTGAEAAERPLILAFDQSDTAGIYGEAHRAILEAVGKTGSLESLQAMAKVSTYLPSDTFLLEGQAWGIYRFALRDITDPAGTNRMLDLVTNNTYPTSVRWIAANYLQRAALTIDSSRTDLITAFQQSEDPRIRMALAIGLGKMKSRPALVALEQRLVTETDWRVKTSILRAFSNFAYPLVRESVFAALQDPNTHIGRRAAQYLLENGIATDADGYRRLAQNLTDWHVQLPLYAAAQRHLPVYMIETRNIINFQLGQRIQRAVSPFEKAAAIAAYSEFNWNYRNIWNLSREAPSPVVRTAGVEGIARISSADNFANFFGLASRRVRQELAAIFQEVIEAGDVGSMAVAAIALRDADRDYKSILPDPGFIRQAMNQLPLPEAIETYNELNKTLQYLQGAAEPTPLKVDNYPAIDWSLFTKLGQRPRASITTSKGLIVLELWPERAPATVANLIQLATEQFYDGKLFHRVVPNFVVQGGGTRGDGYGSLDYVIRSELVPFHYDEAGVIGMASAGKHTEGTQFFITHSPAPHLDANYTAFGKIVRGQDVLDQIQVGDEITRLQME